jgi:hypothetical protein
MKKYLALIGIVVGMLLMVSGCGEKDEVILTRGTWNGNQFTNEKAGVTFNLPEDWVVSTDEEMAAMLGSGTEILANSDLGYSEEEIKKSIELTTIYDFIAADSNGASNVMVIYENLKKQSSTRTMNEKKYIEFLSSQIEAAGMGYEVGEVSELKIGDINYATLTVTLSMGGASLEQVYLVRRQGNYMINILITIMPESDLETLVGYFE